MRMDFATLADKIAGCWLGKNIGGVLGAPFEGQRRLPDIDFYAQDLTAGPPPNDDLDLQLVWLNAVERFGRAVDATILAEYWTSYIIPDWVEYGTGKRNLRLGLPPGLSGLVDNAYRNSCGCFIRSEIWACLAPGHPEIAAAYAYEDGCVDHAEEGLAAEIFCAALQSAAFAESDPLKLIAIGRSYLPDESAVARGVDTVIAAWREGVDWREARRRVRHAVPGSFGLQCGRMRDRSAEPRDGTPDGEAGFDAPENVAYVVLGWLYGEGDFGQSLCRAVGCGEDTDCTAATLGAILGIVNGAKALPEKWVAPLGNKIAQLCVNRTNGGVAIPQTIEELTDRTLRQIPVFLGRDIALNPDAPGYTVTLEEGEALYSQKPAHEISLPGLQDDRRQPRLKTREKLSASPWRTYHRAVAFDAALDYHGSLLFLPQQPRRLRLELWNNWTFGSQFWADVEIRVPAGVRVNGGRKFVVPLQYTVGAKSFLDFELDTAEYPDARLELAFDIHIPGRTDRMTIPVLLLRGPVGS